MCHFVVEKVLVPLSLEYGESVVGEEASQNTEPNAFFDTKLEPTLHAQENDSNLAPSLAHVLAHAHANIDTSCPIHSFTDPNTPLSTHIILLIRPLTVSILSLIKFLTLFIFLMIKIYI